MSPKLEPIRRSILVRCPVEQAFRVFTEGMPTWWPLDTHSRAGNEQIPEVTAVGVEIEPRVGGRILERLSSGQKLSWGEVLVWEPPAHLVLGWKPNHRPSPPTELELSFRREGSGTRVSLVHRGWERLGDSAEKTRDGYARDWPKLFDARFGEAAGRAG